MQQIIMVMSNMMEYITLVVIELLHILGQQLHTAQAADPKQHAAELPREIIAPINFLYYLL